MVGFISGQGSYYLYEKDGRVYPVAFHGPDAIFEPLRKRLIKETGLKLK
jgi:mRNA interferase HicA